MELPPASFGMVHLRAGPLTLGPRVQSPLCVDSNRPERSKHDQDALSPVEQAALAGAAGPSRTEDGL